MQSEKFERGSAKIAFALLVAGALALAVAGLLYYRRPELFSRKAATPSAAKPGTLTESPSGAPSGTAGGSSQPQATSRSGTGNDTGVAASPPASPTAKSAPGGNNSKAAVASRPQVPPTVKLLPSAPTSTASPQPLRPRLQPDPSIPIDEPPASTRPLSGSSTSAPSGPASIPPYTGQRSGTLLWSGTLEKDGVVTIEGNHASTGSLTGELPGVPVEIDVDAREFGVAEAPAPTNGWKRIAIRSRRKRNAVVTIKWTALP